ncbi:MAG: hypothetical protein ACKO0Z_02915 [Betaproteobacteria bacterium]
MRLFTKSHEYYTWKEWWAWYPVFIRDATNYSARGGNRVSTWVWLETVYYRQEYQNGPYDYRLDNPTKN